MHENYIKQMWGIILEVMNNWIIEMRFLDLKYNSPLMSQQHKHPQLLDTLLCKEFATSPSLLSCVFQLALFSLSTFYSEMQDIDSNPLVHEVTLNSCLREDRPFFSIDTRKIEHKWVSLLEKQTADGSQLVAILNDFSIV